MITFNVGGQFFSTNANTLRKSPYFIILAKNNHDAQNPKNNVTAIATIATASDKDKNSFSNLNGIFIDRDPKTFDWILNYLRGYPLCFKYGPLSEKDKQIQLLEDAKFYGIKSLEMLICEQLSPRPSYDDLVRLDADFKKEYANMYKISDIVSQPENYIPLEHINETTTDLLAQIHCRETAIKNWKVQRYTQSCKKIILSICMILEYILPESIFTANLGSAVNKKLNENTELRAELDAAVAYYLENRGGKPFSPILQLLLSLILTIFFQGINHPKPDLANKPKLNLSEIFSGYDVSSRKND